MHTDYLTLDLWIFVKISFVILALDYYFSSSKQRFYFLISFVLRNKIKHRESQKKFDGQIGLKFSHLCPEFKLEIYCENFFDSILILIESMLHLAMDATSSDRVSGGL